MISLSSAILALAMHQGPTVQVTDLKGNLITPLVQRGQKATVFLFVLAECPIANKYAPEIKRIQAHYGPKGIHFYLVHAEPNPNLQAVRKHATEYGYKFPVVIDPPQALVKLTGAQKTPEAAVYDSRERLVYRGRIDDRFVALGKETKPKNLDLRNALDAFLAGKPIAVARTEAVGCVIPRATGD